MSGVSTSVYILLRAHNVPAETLASNALTLYSRGLSTEIQFGGYNHLTHNHLLDIFQEGTLQGFYSLPYFVLFFFKARVASMFLFPVV